jgi:hypothetical protein
LDKERDEKLEILCESFARFMYENTQIFNAQLLRDLQIFQCYAILNVTRKSNGELDFLRKTKILFQKNKDKYAYKINQSLQHFIDNLEEGEGEDNG